MCLVVLILLVMAILYFCYVRPHYYSKPDCSKLQGDAAIACKKMSAMCGGDSACLNAIAQCMPAATGGAPTPCQTRACVGAITRVDPSTMAGIIGNTAPLACMPNGVSRSGFRKAAEQASAALPLIPYALRVAEQMPACPAGMDPAQWQAAIIKQMGGVGAMGNLQSNVGNALRSAVGRL